MSKLSKGRLKIFLYHLVMSLICVFFVFPFYYIASNALKLERLIIAYPPVWFFCPTFKHFITVIVDHRMHNYLINSLIISSLATMIGLGIAAFASYSLVRYHQRKLALLILAATMVPYIICIIPLFILFYRLRWLDTYHGLILTHLIITIPQSVWILMSFMEGIPRELEESGMVEGCSRAKAFLYIVLPLIKPGLVAAGILVFSISWNDFKIALVLTGRYTTTAPVGLYNSLGMEIIDWGALSAGSTIMIIPGIIFALLIQKHLIRGLTIGGV